MFTSETKKGDSKKRGPKDTAAEVVDIFDSLITAFILALLFITFVMQVFIIPTGSMAETLNGAHCRLRCTQCGYRYDHGFKPGVYRLPENTIPRGKVNPPPTRCPSCGYYQSTASVLPVTKGDKILVLKCLHQFFEPKRWDVTVFKYPLDPREKYIKRLIGLPGETIEIIDGDIYIDGAIARKPANVQEEMWMPVYDNDYQPVRPREGSFNGHFWGQPFKNIGDSKWTIQGDSPSVFRLDSAADEINTLVYDSSAGNNFRATSAYNDVRVYGRRSYCSDLMVRFYAESGEPNGRIGAVLSKYRMVYKGWFDFSGDMVIARVFEGKEEILAHKSVEDSALGRPVLVKFANVDHQLIFQIGDERLIYDLGRSAGDAGSREAEIEPQMRIFGSGELSLSHVAIYRDSYYTQGGRRPAFGTEGNPFVLGDDEFFMLGDNSSDSQDSRLWPEPGKGNGGKFYRAGVVPRDYLVGKALFVFWPSGFKPFSKFPFAFIPDVGQMKVIYGGSNKRL